MRKKCVAIFLTVALLFVMAFATVSCTEEPDLPEAEETVFTSDVQASTEACAYGNYIYQRMNGDVYRYNRLTAERSYACMDPECDGECLIHYVHGLFGVYDDKLFFTTSSSVLADDGVTWTTNKYFAYQDLRTGTVSVIRESNELTSMTHYGMLVHEGYIYYVISILKEGGDPTVASDYWPTLCRMPIEGGKEEVVYPLTSYNEGLICIWKGKLITMCDGVICSYDPATETLTELFEHEDAGYVAKPQNLCTLNGKMYFIGKTKVPVVYPGGFVNEQYLCVLDLETGEYRRIVEDEITQFFIMDDAVYYKKLDVRPIYDSENDEEDLYKPHSAELYACDLDGGNERVVYTHETMLLMKDMMLIDNCLYGWVLLYDEDAHEYMYGMRYRKIDLTTGEIIAPINLFEE